VFIERIRIANFKSLKDVEIRPSGLTALVGPNNAGKSNFALAMNFLAEVHQHGLEAAIARAGGIENIALRKMRRCTSAIAFEVEVGIVCRKGPGELQRAQVETASGWEDVRRLTFSHCFSCRASAQGIRADFVVVSESVSVFAHLSPQQGQGSPTGTLVCELSRDAAGKVAAKAHADSYRLVYEGVSSTTALDALVGNAAGMRVGQQALLTSSLFVDVRLLALWRDSLAQLGVFRFSGPDIRGPGTPTPNPKLLLGGGNLPALVDWLQRRQGPQWTLVLDTMRNIVPGLEDIIVDVLPSRTLGLFFVEKGFGRPWRADEVSDGTMRALSMLVAAADPRVSALVIEEPENSLHPWIIQELGRRLRTLAEKKTVILTTQSPVVVDLLYPSELWVVSRKKGQTRVRQLTEIDPRIEGEWRDGVANLSDYLGSGLVPQLVPPGEEA